MTNKPTPTTLHSTLYLAILLACKTKQSVASTTMTCDSTAQVTIACNLSIALQNDKTVCLVEKHHPM